jgi:chromate transporter
LTVGAHNRGRGGDQAARGAGAREQVRLTTIARSCARVGLTGFGGPPTLVAMLRELCVVDRGWVTAHEFQDAVAAAGLLPGPAATQLGIYCAWRARGWLGGVVGGLCLTLPGTIIVTGLSVVFLSEHPPLWAQGAGAGAGAAVAAVAVNAAVALMPASWRRMGEGRAAKVRWATFTLLGGAAAATVGSYLVLVLLACGLAEVALRESEAKRSQRTTALAVVSPVAAGAAAGGMAALVWVALKVGALSYGGGFVIVPLMQHDAVQGYHWMTAGQFLTAVALGQITPGPVVQTVAVVGYAAAGLLGAVVAAVVAFAPSFALVLGGARHFDRVRQSLSVRSFLDGAGPAAIGAIAGSAIPLGLALGQLWQVAVLAFAFVWIVGLRRNLVLGLVVAGVIGLAAALAGLPVGP